MRVRAYCLAFAVLLAGLVAPARANLITLENISGDDRSLHAEFSMTWGSFPVGTIGPTDSLAATWAGGSLVFRFAIADQHSPSLGHVRDFHVILQTTWNDGWMSLPMLGQHEFPGGMTIPFVYPLAHLLKDLRYTNNGLTYFATGTYRGTFTSALDYSGNARIAFDYQRLNATPEVGGTLLLLIGGSGALALLRGFGVKRVGAACGSNREPHAVLSLPPK